MACQTLRFNETYRKGLVYHKARGKCSQEPRWIRWTRGRPICIHPDCLGKQDVEFTYSAMMRHIIEEHNTPETSVSCLNFCIKTSRNLFLFLCRVFNVRIVLKSFQWPWCFGTIKKWLIRYVFPHIFNDKTKT